MLIGNKCDAESLRQVDREQGEAMARKMEVPFYECSCKNNINISPMFEELCEKIHDYLEQNVSFFNFF